MLDLRRRINDPMIHWPINIWGGTDNVAAWYPSELFASSEDGGVYDVSDLTSMYVGIKGTGGNPEVGDVVGVILDKSQMGNQTAAEFIAAQTELITNGTFDTDLSGWTDTSTGAGTATWSAGTVVLFNPTSSSTRGRIQQTISVTAGVSYLITFDVLSGALTLNVPGTSDVVAYGAGSHTRIFKSASTGTGDFSIERTYAGTTVVDNFSIKAIPGNHLIAPSDAARPKLYDEIVDGLSVDVSGQPELVVDQSAWTPYGTNTIVADGSEYRVTYVDNVNGFYYSTSSVMDGDTWYAVSFDARVDSGDSTSARFLYGGDSLGTIYSPITNTTAQTFSFLIRSKSSPSSELIRFDGFGAGEIGWVSNVSVKEVPASAARRYYLDFDGTDDLLQIGSNPLYLETDITLATAFDPVSDTTYIMYAVDGGVGAFVGAAADGSASTSNVGSGSLNTLRVDGSNTEAATRDAFEAALAGAPRVVLHENINFSSAAWGADLGIFNYDAVAWFLDGKWYGSVLLDRALTDIERYKLEYWLATKSGVTYAVPVLDGVPTLSGEIADPTVGETLTVVPASLSSGWEGANTYQWLRDGSPITGATSTTYTLVSADVGSVISCRQRHTNSAGSDTATSAATSAVEAVSALHIVDRDGNEIFDRAGGIIEVRA